MADSFSSKGSTTGDPGKRTYTSGDLILESLEDLGEYDFKKFKSKLSDLPEEENVPRGKLDNADRIDTKDLLIRTYGEERAIQVVYEVLERIKLVGPANDLQERIKQNAKLKKIKCEDILAEWRKEYMESVKESYQRFTEYNFRLGEAIYLQDRYTELLLIMGPQNKEGKKYEITSLGKKHLESMRIKSSDKRSSTTIQGLFDPDEHNFVPKIVVLQGPAGIGKTMTSKKMMMDWASGNLYEGKFNFLFYVSCTKINKVNGDINLAGLLTRACRQQFSDDHLEQLLKDFRNHRNLLFIIDGFDKLKWTVEKESEVYKDLSKETNKETLIQSLLKKQILKDSHLIITTRPLVLENLKTFFKDSRCVEILGFTGENRVRFLYSFFKNKDEADKVLSVIKNNDILLTMCAVPMICWIVCTVMKQEIQKDCELNPCKTATSLYLLYLKSLIKYHGRKLPVHTSLKKLCALAKEGVLNQQILFEEEDLERHGLSVSEAESVFLNENIFHQNVDNQTCYSFVHLSVQEFFAALYYGLECESGDNEEDPSLPEICKGDSFSSLCKHHPHLTVAVQFLFGLLNQQVVKEYLKSTGIKLSFPYRFAIKKWFLGQSSHFNTAEAILCLYETQDEDFISGIMTHISGLELGDLNDYSSSFRNCLEELSYCLNTCDSFKSLELTCLTMGPKYAERLSPSLHKCQKLCFQHCRFPQMSQFQRKGGEDCLEKEKTFDYSIHCDPWRKDSENLSWLVKSHSKIEELTFFRCGLNESSYASIGSFMSKNKSLTCLDLSENYIDVSGVKILCDIIRHPSCNLQELRLNRCGLYSRICENLRSVLITSRSLTRLHLCDPLLDSGTKLLCEGLGDPRCILQELSLDDCCLTSLCCDDLRSVLITNRSLIKLDLSHNELEDSGVDLLCDALKDPRCSLQELRLECCNLSSLCCAGFLSVLIANRSLTKLDLSQNKLEDSGVKCLCEGLRLPGCILQELSLLGCGLTPLCCDDLRSVLISNKSLIKLDLTFNRLEDSGVKCLCEGLRSPDCMLQELRIYDSEATFLCLEDLLTVLRTNRTLTKLTATLDIDEETSNLELHRICRPFLYLNCSYKWERFERIWMKIKYRRPNVPNWTGFCCCK